MTIEVPDMGDTKRWMKQMCDSQIASDVWQDNKPLLDNLADMLQCGFGIYLGFNEAIEEDET